MAFEYTHAIVRDLPYSFNESLKQKKPLEEINVDLARIQHDRYVQTLSTIVPNIIQVINQSISPKRKIRYLMINQIIIRCTRKIRFFTPKYKIVHLFYEPNH